MKIKEVATWVRQKRIDLLVLIETMRNDIPNHLVSRLWGSNDYKWVSVESQRRSGDILYNWDINFIEDETVTKGERWVWIHGFIQEIEMVGVIGIICGYHDVIGIIYGYHYVIGIIYGNYIRVP